MYMFSSGQRNEHYVSRRLITVGDSASIRNLWFADSDYSDHAATEESNRGYHYSDVQAKVPERTGCRLRKWTRVE